MTPEEHKQLQLQLWEVASELIEAGCTLPREVIIGILIAAWTNGYQVGCDEMAATFKEAFSTREGKPPPMGVEE